MRLSFIFLPSAPWKIFGTPFQSSQHTGDVVLLELCKDFCVCVFARLPPITQIQKSSKTTNGGEQDFTCIENLKVSFLCMI
jgi:hypothetical protein